MRYNELYQILTKRCYPKKLIVDAIKTAETLDFTATKPNDKNDESIVAITTYSRTSASIKLHSNQFPIQFPEMKILRCYRQPKNFMCLLKRRLCRNAARKCHKKPCENCTFVMEF